MRKIQGIAAIAAVSSLVLAGCANPFTARGKDTTGDINIVAATTNVDDTSKIKAGKNVQIDAQDPWVIERVVLTLGGESETFSVNASSWKSKSIPPNQNVTVEAFLRNPATGDTNTVTREFRTGKPSSTYSAQLFPTQGTYGVGVVPTVTFDQSIPYNRRKAIVKNLHVTTSPETVEGSWRWTSESKVAFRPAKYWPAKTKVSLQANLKQIPVKVDGVTSWGSSDESSNFKIGRKLVVSIDSNTHSAVVKIDNKKARSFGISLGKPGYTTRSGIKTITDRIPVQRMTNVGVTNDEVYDLQVPWAMRVTDTGEFLHGAPWNGNIGYANTSHGCTNLTYNDAKWLFDQALWGDVVITKNTGRPMDTTNGPGAVWNMSYAEWSKQMSGASQTTTAAQDTAS